MRRIFERYLALGSVGELKTELDCAGICTPRRVYRSGRGSGGTAFSRGKLFGLLTNPVFIGRIRHKDLVHPGQHPAIVDEAVWQAVQEKLKDNRNSQTLQPAARSPSPLAGKLLDPDGKKMRPAHAHKKGRRYRYYISRDLVERRVAGGAQGWRIPARELEAAVANALANHIRQPDFSSSLLSACNLGADASGRIIARLSRIADQLDPASADTASLLRSLVNRVELAETELRVAARLTPPQEIADDDPLQSVLSDHPPFTLTMPIALQRRGPELRLVLGGEASRETQLDPVLLRTLIEARVRAADYLSREERLTVSDVARRYDADISDVSRTLQLAFLAPGLVEAILDGTQPVALTAERLKRLGELPLLWIQQTALIA